MYAMRIFICSKSISTNTLLRATIRLVVKAMTESNTKLAEKKPILALEPPPPRDSNSPIQLNVSTSEPVSLYNQLGPTIVASDGVSIRFVIVVHPFATCSHKIHSL